MYDNDKKSQFVELRARGKSFERIAKELAVSKPTLIAWSKVLSDEIGNMKALELDALSEQYSIQHCKRIELLGKLLKKVEDELEGRALKELSTGKLMELTMRLLHSIHGQEPDVIFRTTLKDEAAWAHQKDDTRVEEWSA